MTRAPCAVPARDELETILQHAADAITVQAADGSLVYANQAAARTLGFDSPEALLETPTTELMTRYALLDEAGDPFPVEQLPSRRALAGSSVKPRVIRFRDLGSGNEHWSLVQAIPILDGSGAVRMVINTFQDVTKLKRTERRLRLLADVGAVLGRSVDYQQTLQELADLIVGDIADWCVVDVLDGDGRASRVAIAHADPAKRQVAEELQRHYPPDPNAPSGVHEVIRTGVPTLMTEVSAELLRTIARDDEHRRLLQEAGIASAVIVPLRARGEVFGALTLIGSPGRHRFSEPDLPLIEELARRAATAIDNARLLHDANEAIRLRDDFLAMASHDMRTPLAVILANLQLAGRRLADANVDEPLAIQNLDAAERTTQKLAGLVGELMDISILRSGQPLPLSRAPVDLALVTQGTTEEYRRLDGDHDITTRLEDGVVGEWDAVRIERVLRNVLDNALKYSPDGAPVEVTVRSEDGWAVLEVTDHGVGIPEEELPRLFEKSHRGSKARDLRGTGLGLAGSLAVVEQLDGSIAVRSRLGQGSTFELRLPLGTVHEG